MFYFLRRGPYGPRQIRPAKTAVSIKNFFVATGKISRLPLTKTVQKD